jgi:endoglucanase
MTTSRRTSKKQQTPAGGLAAGKAAGIMDYLRPLSEAVGISGREEAVRTLVLDAIQGHVDSIRIDALGSVQAIKRGTDGANRPKVMIAAHMDEVGFMVTGVDNDGLVRFTVVGAIDDRILPGLRVRVGDDAIPGVILWTPIHRNNDQKVVKAKNLRIDIGASGKDAANGKVKKGDRIAFDTQYIEIGERMLRGKSFDDRVGCSVLIDVLRGGPYAVDVLAAFTVQEEIGLRGAQVAAQTLQPDAAFVLEGTTANDLPDPHADQDRPLDVNPTCRVGRGPVLSIMDRSMIVDPRLLRFLRAAAEDHYIPYQLKTMPGGATDGGIIHRSAGGAPTAVISMPVRYIHTPAALINREDYQHDVALVKAALNALTWDALRF